MEGRHASARRPVDAKETPLLASAGCNTVGLDSTSPQQLRFPTAVWFPAADTAAAKFGE